MKRVFLYVLGAFCFVSCSNKQSSTNILIEPGYEEPKVSSWEIGNYVNDYGEHTNSHYIYQVFNGSIDWSDGGSSQLKAIISITKGREELFEWVDIKLRYGNDSPIIGSLKMDSKLKIKNERNEELEVDIFGDDGSYGLSEDEKLLNLFKEGGTLKVAGFLRTRTERTARLRFTISDSYGLNELIDSVYSLERTDTVAAMIKKRENDSIFNEWQKRHR